jgi:hypothetical protein
MTVPRGGRGLGCGVLEFPDAAGCTAGLIGGLAVSGGVFGIFGGELVVEAGEGLLGVGQVCGLNGQARPGGSDVPGLLVGVTGWPSRPLPAGLGTAGIRPEAVYPGLGQVVRPGQELV